MDPLICLFELWWVSICEDEGGERRLVTVSSWDVCLYSFFAVAGLSWLDDDIEDGIIGTQEAEGRVASTSVGDPYRFGKK